MKRQSLFQTRSLRIFSLIAFSAISAASAAQTSNLTAPPQSSGDNGIMTGTHAPNDSPDAYGNYRDVQSAQRDYTNHRGGGTGAVGATSTMHFNNYKSSGSDPNSNQR